MSRQQVAAAVGSSGVDALVNNAGGAVTAPVEHLPLDVFRQQIEVNLTGEVPSESRCHQHTCLPYDMQCTLQSRTIHKYATMNCLKHTMQA